MKIEPLGNRVLIQTVENKMTEGGIIRPGNLIERYLKGKVLAVGIGEVCGTHEVSIVLKKVSVSPRDVVLFDSARAIDVGEGKFLVDAHDLQCKYVEQLESETS